jgi:hypothetical protein
MKVHFGSKVGVQKIIILNNGAAIAIIDEA